MNLLLDYKIMAVANFIRTCYIYFQRNKVLYVQCSYGHILKLYSHYTRKLRIKSNNREVYDPYAWYIGLVDE